MLHRVEGRYPDGTPIPPQHGGGGGAAWGATEDADGDSSQQMIFLNMLSGGVESAEHAGCSTLRMRSEYVPDSGGAGAFRGGAANVHDTLWRYPAAHRIQQLHVRRPPGGGGVRGGRAGLLGGVWLWDGVGVEGIDDQVPGATVDDLRYAAARPMSGMIDPASNQVDPAGDYVVVPEMVPAAAGTVFRTLTMGGGGWGDPFTRDPERVLVDVRDGYVSVAGAARDYGVVVLGDPDRDPEGISVDLDATTSLREERRPR
jgi:N-methylhydantoinase B